MTAGDPDLLVAEPDADRDTTIEILYATTRVPDLYVDWAATGRESYRIVAAFNVGPHAVEAPLFARLSDLYDRCVLALHFTKRELEQLGRPELRAAGDVLGGADA